MDHYHHLNTKERESILFMRGARNQSNSRSTREIGFNNQQRVEAKSNKEGIFTISGRKKVSAKKKALLSKEDIGRA